MRATEFVKQRKKLILEERTLIMQRILISKHLRSIQKELNGLDTIIMK